MFTVLHFLLGAVGAGAKLGESSPRGVPVLPQPGQHIIMYYVVVSYHIWGV